MTAAVPVSDEAARAMTRLVLRRSCLDSISPEVLEVFLADARRNLEVVGPILVADFLDGVALEWLAAGRLEHAVDLTARAGELRRSGGAA